MIGMLDGVISRELWVEDFDGKGEGFVSGALESEGGSGLCDRLSNRRPEDWMRGGAAGHAEAADEKNKEDGRSRIFIMGCMILSYVIRLK